MVVSAVWQHYRGRGTEESVLELYEAIQGWALPRTYRNFLRLVGESEQAVPGWLGSDWRGMQLTENQAAAREVVANNPSIRRLPDDALVLLMHQGYSFLFVLARLGDESPVYTYAETDSEWQREYRQVSGRLHDTMNALAPDIWADAILVSSV